MQRHHLPFLRLVVGGQANGSTSRNILVEALLPFGHSARDRFLWLLFLAFISEINYANPLMNVTLGFYLIHLPIPLLRDRRVGERLLDGKELL